MGKKLYVGNLSYSVDSSELEKIFSAHGTVSSAQIISDRETGRSKGFGFVEMNSDAEAQAAIAALNGQDYQGRTLTVNEARGVGQIDPVGRFDGRKVYRLLLVGRKVAVLLIEQAGQFVPNGPPHLICLFHAPSLRTFGILTNGAYP